MGQRERVAGLFRDSSPDRRFHDPKSVLEAVAGLDLRDRPRVLDLGCGSGLLALDLARAYPEATVLGLDPVPEQVERARGNLAASGLENARFEIGDAETFPFEPGGFDLVLMLQVVQFLERPAEALARAHAALEPNGALLATSAFLPEEEPGRSFARSFWSRTIPHTPFWASQREWRGLLERAGFRGVEARPIPTYPLRTLPPERAAILAEELPRWAVTLEDAERWIEGGLVVAR